MPYIYFDRGSDDVAVAGFDAMALGSMFGRKHSSSSDSRGCQTDSREALLAQGLSINTLLTRPL